MGPLLWKVPCMEVPLCPRVRQEQGAAVWERRDSSPVARLRGGTGNSCESQSGSHGGESPYRILVLVLGVFKPSLSPAVTSVLSVLKRTTLTLLPGPALVPAP